MPQVFNTMQDLVNYIDTHIIPNGVRDINGTEHNNVENGLASFIVKYTLNNQTALISSSGGDIVLSRPITIFTAKPDSVQWPDNLQNEYYIVNATGFDIALAAGFSYVDPYQVSQTVIPLRSTLHIAKAQNGSWMQVNNIAATGANTLPPQTGHEGEFLFTNGNSAEWRSPVLFIDSSDFEADGVTYLNPALQFSKFALFFNDANRFIYSVDEEPAQIEFQYVVGGGFEITMPGFNAGAGSVHFYLLLKGLNS
jgi:hypothetical protein